MTIFVHTSDTAPVIVNMENHNSGNTITPEVLNALNEQFDYAFIVNKNDLAMFEGLLTVSDSPFSTFHIVTDDNVDGFIGHDLNHVYLMVNDVSRLFENFMSIAGSSRVIEFRLTDEPDYDLLDKELEKVSRYIIDLEKTNHAPIVKNLNGFGIKEKFDRFGEDYLFMDCSGNIYHHPGFYYAKQSPIGHISTFEVTERITHFTKPHLICAACETFYCDRNIYQNKMKTSEYAVPASETCKLTNLITKHSKKIFNEMSGIELPITELDVVDSFEADTVYKILVENRCNCNNIKGTAFPDRMIKGGL